MAADLSREAKILSDREERRRFFQEMLNPEFDVRGEVDKVMICGKSGAGKTALSTLLIEPNTGHEPQFYIEKDIGHRLRLHGGTIPRGRFANAANQALQISSNSVPGTVEPMGLTNGRGGWYWDCPGFYNPTGDAEEILNAARFRQLVSRGGIKFLLVMQKAEIQDRLTDVVDIYKRLVRMFPDRDRLFRSTQLVVTRFFSEEIGGIESDDFRGIIQRNADSDRELRKVFIADAESPDIALGAMNLHQHLVRQMGLFPSAKLDAPVGERYDSDGKKREAIESLLSSKDYQKWPDAHLSIGEKAAAFLREVCEKWVKEFCGALATRMPIPERLAQESFDVQVWRKFKLLEGLKLKGSEHFFRDIKEFLTPEVAVELENVSGHLDQLNMLMGSSIRDFDRFVLGQKRFIVDELRNAINLNVIAHQVAAYIKGCIYFDGLEQDIFWGPVLEWDERIDALGPLKAKIQRLQQRGAEQGQAVDFLDTSSIQTFLKDLKPGIWRSNIEHMRSYLDEAVGPLPEQRAAILQSFDLEVILRKMDEAWKKGEVERKLIAEIRREYPRAPYQDWKKFRHRNFRYSLKLSDQRAVHAVESYSFTTLPMFESFLVLIGLGADGLFEEEERDRPLAALGEVAPLIGARDIRDLRIILAQQTNENVSTLNKCHEVLSIPLFVGVTNPQASPKLLSMWLTPSFFCEDANVGESELITVVAKYRIPQLMFDGKDELPAKLTLGDIRKVNLGQLTVNSDLKSKSKSCTSFVEIFRNGGAMQDVLSSIEKEIDLAYQPICKQLEKFDKCRDEIRVYHEAIKTFTPVLTGAGAGITAEVAVAAVTLAQFAAVGTVAVPVGVLVGSVATMYQGGRIQAEIESACAKIKEARDELAKVREFTLPLLQSWNNCRLKVMPEIHLSMEARGQEELIPPSRLFADVVQLSVADIRNVEGRAVAAQAVLQQ